MEIINKKENNKIIFIEILRVICMLAVVTIHLLTNDIHNHINEFNTFNLITYNILEAILRFCVPVFVMITGYLLLEKRKNITIKQIFCKYIFRMALVLIIFGFSFSLGERAYLEKKINLEIIINSLCDIITGNLWAHMWYIYLLIYLYLLTPILKIYINNANKKEIIYFVLLLFIMTSIFPLIEQVFNINFRINLSEFSAYLIYYLVGYCMRDIFKFNRYKKLCKILLIVMLVLLGIISVVYSLFKIDILQNLLNYTSPIIIIFSVCIFILFKDKNWNINSKTKNVILFLGENCFGIYIIHQLFINGVYKVFNIYPIRFGGIVYIPLFLITIVLLSLVVTVLLWKNTVIRKYVL